MMPDTSSRFALPFLRAGQAQKEIMHNEALARIDALLHAGVEAVFQDDPPGTLALGQSWVIGPSPTGAWSGKAGMIASWGEGGWILVAARPGMLAWVIGLQLWAHHDGSDWIVGDIPAASVRIGGVQLLGSRQAAIGNPAGGAVVDGEARAAITALLGALRTHGIIAT